MEQAGGILRGLKERLPLRRSPEIRQSALQFEQAIPPVETNEVVVRKEYSRKREIRKILAGVHTNQRLVSANAEQSVTVEAQASAFKRAINIISDPRIVFTTRSAVEVVGVAVGLEVTAALLGSSLLSNLAWPVATVYGIGRLANLAYSRVGLELGSQLSMHKQSTLLGRQTPVGRIERGEQFGTLHLYKYGEIAKFAAQERMVQVPLEGLIGLAILSEKIKRGDPDVAKIRIFEAKSPIVTQNPKLFEKIGFKLEPPNTSKLRGVVTALDKALFILTFGVNKLFKRGGIRGFTEASNFRTLNPRGAWITAEDLQSNGLQVQEQIQRFQSVAAKLGAKVQSSSNNLTVRTP